MTTTVQQQTATARVGVVGLGNMGGALAAGWLTSGVLAASDLVGFDPSPGARAGFGGSVLLSATEVARAGRVVVLAVKPHLLPLVCGELSRAQAWPELLISIAAGVPVSTIRRFAPAHVAVVRAMPNLAATVGASTTALWCEAEDAAWLAEAERLFAAVGTVMRLGREQEMHVFTALASSGPAFAAVFAEALADAGVAGGLSRSTARTAAASMLRGTAELLARSEASPAELKDAVSSPGGTTIAGLAALESAGFRAAVLAAVGAATARSRELAGDP